MFTEKTIFAFVLTLAAGLSTGIGSVIALFAKKTNTKFLSVSLGFSAGVMIYVSMIEIFANARDTLTEELGGKGGAGAAAAAFFGGMILIALIDKLIPLKGSAGIKDVTRKNGGEKDGAEKNGGGKDNSELPGISAPKILRTGFKRGKEKGEATGTADIFSVPKTPKIPKMPKILKKEFPKSETETAFSDRGARAVPSPNLMRSGLLTALALGIHNFPEGLATFVSALQDAKIAVPIVAAIAIHNIPEGIAVSVPIYYATGNKKKAFGYSFFSGITEPLGALIGYFILLPFLNAVAMGIVCAAVAGIMVFISIDGLLPSAREYGEHHLSIVGLVGGMAVMAFSLVLFA
ncbi:MAG: zinc transporter ZupT [Clostridiales bacterium]|jgi:ZIP family zinc transporter|nr:zinc transporter ZupT [Clostridiales bacterium]